MLRKSYRLMQKTKTLIDQTRHDVSAIGNSFYTRTFDRTVPKVFACCPPDIWSGDAARGAELVTYVFGLRSEQLAAFLSPAGFTLVDDTFHGFGWLTDLVADGTNDARRVAVMMIENWIIQNNDTDGPAYRPDLVASRLLRWIGAYSFYFPALDPVQNEHIVGAVARQTRHLKRICGNVTDAMDGLRVGAGLIAGGVALSHDPSWIEQGLKVLERHARTMILADGGPHTRSPSDLPVLLRILLDVRGLLDAAALPVPSFLTHAIDRVVPALRFFRMGDHKLTVFHGGFEELAIDIEDVLQKSGVKCRAPASLPYAGFEKLVANKTQIIMDTGVVDGSAGKHLHASILAFEMSVGTDRVIVNCGQHAHDKMWQDLLSATAAHSTLSLDHQDNVVFARAGRRGQVGAHVDVARSDSDNGILVEAAHTGYMTRNGFSHRRRLYLSADGADLRGQDDLTVTIPPVMPMDYTVRFHLHPRVSAALTAGGTDVLLRTASGAGLRFCHDGGTAALEDSVYLGETGLPQKTRQIVVTGKIFGATQTIRWAIQAETASDKGD